MPMQVPGPKISRCHFCGNTVPMTKVAHHVVDPKENNQQGIDNSFPLRKIWNMYYCAVCCNIKLEVSELRFGHGDSIITSTTLYPSIYSNENIPKNIQQAFEAATLVKRIDGALCSLSLRRTLEMICKDKGETKGTLYDKLKRLSERNILPPIINDMAFILKDVGNEAAHGDDIQFPQDLINLLIEFIQSILEYVYVIPSKLSEVQNKLKVRTEEMGE